jgi:hypothetical protein
MVASFTKKDPPPHHVKPVPIAVLGNVCATASASQCPIQQATADMIILAFFFLLRPGEYTAKSTSEDAHPFLLENVQLFVGPTHRLDLFTATPAQLQQATFATLTFANQKNGVKDEVVGHAQSGDPYLCPVLALIRHVVHLRQHQATRNTPLGDNYVNEFGSTRLAADEYTRVCM